MHVLCLVRLVQLAGGWTINGPSLSGLVGGSSTGTGCGWVGGISGVSSPGSRSGRGGSGVRLGSCGGRRILITPPAASLQRVRSRAPQSRRRRSGEPRAVAWRTRIGSAVTELDHPRLSECATSAKERPTSSAADPAVFTELQQLADHPVHTRAGGGLFILETCSDAVASCPISVARRLITDVDRALPCLNPRAEITHHPSSPARRAASAPHGSGARRA